MTSVGTQGRAQSLEPQVQGYGARERMRRKKQVERQIGDRKKWSTSRKRAERTQRADKRERERERHSRRAGRVEERESRENQRDKRDTNDKQGHHPLLLPYTHLAKQQTGSCDGSNDNGCVLWKGKVKMSPPDQSQAHRHADLLRYPWSALHVTHKIAPHEPHCGARGRHQDNDP